MDQLDIQLAALHQKGFSVSMHYLELIDNGPWLAQLNLKGTGVYSPQSGRGRTATEALTNAENSPRRLKTWIDPRLITGYVGKKAGKVNLSDL